MTHEYVELMRGRHALIRLTEESDAEMIVKWRNQPDSARWLNQWKPLTIKEHLRWFHEARERGDLLLFFEALDGTPSGCASIFDFDHSGTSAEFGRFFSARPGGGSKRTLEACYLLYRMCFDALGFFRLYAQVWTDNDRAWRLYQFMGWVQEGIRRKHFLAPDGYHDVRVIGIFPDEFAAQRKAIEEKLYGCEPAPGITDSEAQRLREIVSMRIHRPLDRRKP
ncbi:MAG: GNAT family N-acetyltransferase [Candidatus Krumholzibacteria bacterium]|nr:GNAT family N-acetyltransferase [Candidatus Krumholzibacteria bacterium]